MQSTARGVLKSRPLSITTKLAIAVVVGVLVATMISVATSAWRETGRHLEARRLTLLGLADALGTTVAAPTRAGDKRAVAERLNSIRRFPGVSYAIVVDGEGRRLAEIGHGVVVGDLHEKLKANRDFGVLAAVRLGSYLVSTTIVSGGVEVGHVSLIADVSDLRKALLTSVGEAFTAGIFAALLAVVASTLLLRTIVAPIKALKAATVTVRATGDYARPVPQTSRDEIGELVAAFNVMMTEIASRDEALRRHRDRLADEVAARTRELVAAKEAAEQANAAKSDFLATISHEIRTPMNGMLVMAELLASENLSPTARRRCDVIVQSGGVLLALINDILDLSKIEARKLEIERVPCDPVAIVRDTLELFSATADARGLQLACHCPSPVPALVVGDPLRLRQIVSNLVANAIKFTTEGGVFVEISGAAQGDGRVALSIAVGDTGIGIPADRLDSLFEPFVQADASTSRRFGGTGIGLAICRRLANAMGGSLTATSTPGSGSTFTVSLVMDAVETPAVATDGAEPRTHREPAADDHAEQPRPYEGRRILTVDDSEINREVLEAVLVRLGVRVTSAASGIEALALIERERFDLIFMDGSMPDLDGFETTRRIRAQEERAGAGEVPIIGLTAHVLERHREEGRGAGMNEFMTKPFTSAGISDCLGRWLGTSRRVVGEAHNAVVASAAAQPADVIRAPLLDPAVLAEIRKIGSAGDALVRKVVALYREQAPLRLRELEETDICDAQAIAKAAHALKSLSRNIGAVRVAELCDAIESEASDWRLPSREIAALQHTLTETMNAL